MKRFILMGLLLLSAPAVAADSSDTAAAERALEAKVEQALEAILGPGKVQVTVSGRQDAQAAQTRSRSYSQAQPGSERKFSETTTRSFTGAGTANGAPETTTETATRSNSDTSWVHSQTEELRSTQPGGLSQKSVSVVYEPPAAGDEGEEGGRPLVDPALIEEIAGAAAGIDPSRGDRLVVRAVQMDTSAYDKLRAEMENAARQPSGLVFALIGLGGIALGTGIGVLIMRRRKVPPVQPEWAATGPVPGQVPSNGETPGIPVSAPPQGQVVYLNQPPDKAP